jgi:hypothetical protein
VTGIAGGIEPVDGATDLAATFTAAGLPVPPIPAVLGPALIRRDEWLWATREVDRLEMYDGRPGLGETEDRGGRGGQSRIERRTRDKRRGGDGVRSDGRAGAGGREWGGYSAPLVKISRSCV